MKKGKKEKKRRIKKERNEGEKRKSLALHLRRKQDKQVAEPVEESSFEATLYSSEPILQLQDAKEQPAWKKDLAINCTCAAMLTAAIAIFCMCFSAPAYIPFALTCPVVFMVISIVGTMKEKFAKWIAAGVIVVILLVIALIWRTEIFDGIATLINWFYDAAEEAQAYLYDRLPNGGYATEGACRAGLAWISALIGLVAALPPAKFRRAISILIAIAVMIALAYYGMIPSAVCIAVMIAALVAAIARGNLLSFVPVMMAALLIFGAIMLINPGENYGISRVDENLRDRFALNSALLESNESLYEEEEYEDYEEEEDEYYEDEESGEEDAGIEVSKYTIFGIIAAAVLALGAVIFLFVRRFLRKRNENRKGLKSYDPREAVVAMFPYTVRWLKGFGIEQPEPAFTSMVPELKEKFSEFYSSRFEEMYKMWNEAAYSDHPVSEETRLKMESFMNETIDQVNSNCKFRDKLKLKLRYAL